MEAYATKEATAAALVSLGFIRFDDVWFDSPKEDEFGGPMVQCRIYQCSNKYWCVDVSGAVDGFEAPIVWNGAKADWITLMNLTSSSRGSTSTTPAGGNRNRAQRFLTRALFRQSCLSCKERMMEALPIYEAIECEVIEITLE